MVEYSKLGIKLRQLLLIRVTIERKASIVLNFEGFLSGQEHLVRLVRRSLLTWGYLGQGITMQIIPRTIGTQS